RAPVCPECRQQSTPPPRHLVLVWVVTTGTEEEHVELHTEVVLRVIPSPRCGSRHPLLPRPRYHPRDSA
ncbi:hypothetical protein NHX12_021364, partial [Muraenolepis orangiensis]